MPSQKDRAALGVCVRLAATVHVSKDEEIGIDFDGGRRTFRKFNLSYTYDAHLIYISSVQLVKNQSLVQSQRHAYVVTLSSPVSGGCRRIRREFALHVRVHVARAHAIMISSRSAAAPCL